MSVGNEVKRTKLARCGRKTSFLSTAKKFNMFWKDGRKMKESENEGWTEKEAEQYKSRSFGSS